MKGFIKKIWNKIVNFIKWIWSECKDWKTLVLLLLVCIVMYSPVWVLAIIAIVFKSNWALTVSGAIAAFWMGPFTPFFPIAISITLGLRRLFQKKDKIAEKLEDIKAHHEEHKKEWHERHEEHKKEQQEKHKTDPEKE